MFFLKKLLLPKKVSSKTFWQLSKKQTFKRYLKISKIQAVFRRSIECLAQNCSNFDEHVYLFFFVFGNQTSFTTKKNRSCFFYGKVLHCMVLVIISHGLTTSLVKSKFLYAVFFLIDDGISRFKLAITQVCQVRRTTSTNAVCGAF